MMTVKHKLFLFQIQVLSGLDVFNFCFGVEPVGAEKEAPLTIVSMEKTPLRRQKFGMAKKNCLKFTQVKIRG